MSTPDSDDGFRSRIRTWLGEHLTGEFRNLTRADLDDPDAWATRVRWERLLAAEGLVGLAWPKSAGGREASLHEQLAFAEEYASAGAPDRAGFFGEQLLGPTLIVHGTDDQRARFLPPILRGEEFWCQGYSEPGAGSDLASVTTRAERSPAGRGRAGRGREEWVISGQKVWTSLAQFADWIFVLCRTDPGAPKHRGLSLLLCPLDQPGVEIRPIRQITGGQEFNEVFFDGARTDIDLVVGPVDGGWRVAMAVLGFERGTAFLGQQRMFARGLRRVVDSARRRGLLAEPVMRQRLADAWLGLELIRFVGLRTVGAYDAGGVPGPSASIGKLLWSQWHQRFGELAMDVAGPAGTVLDRGVLDELQHSFLFARQDTIAAGSSEIQRNVIAERVLGLPPG